LINTYWIFISDLDGDNCPFHPSCSSFFLESIEETNLIQGTLMFFDRFTRDSNPVNREEHYPVYKNYRFYDPPKLYTLSKEKIQIIPPHTVVE
jgi:putative component of membrane protein insertase Oxa1/YidC/SpoIIIJ protein YidD